MNDLPLSSALDEETARAELYGLLAALFYAPPAPELLAQLRVAPTEAPSAGAYLEEHWRALVGAARATSDAAIQDEFDALFGGVGKPVVSVYGSEYLSGFLNEKPLAALRDDLARLGLARDAINRSTGSHTGQRKQVVDLLVGLTQVLGTHDIAQVNLAWRSGKGFFTDPYKVFDNRPRTRNSATLLARWNHHLDATGGTLRSSYRWFGDTYGIQAHTLGFEYVQPLLGGWSLMPLVRLYTQSKARFYVEANADPDYPFPPNPPDDAVHYSEDQRVSAFGAHTWGLKLARQIGNDWLVDLKFEQYGQRASWRLFGSGSPRLAAFDARSWQLGITRQF